MNVFANSTPFSLTVDVTLLWIAMGVFAAAFVIISFVAIPEPNLTTSGKKVKYAHSPWNFRHLVHRHLGTTFIDKFRHRKCDRASSSMSALRSVFPVHSTSILPTRAPMVQSPG